MEYTMTYKPQIGGYCELCGMPIKHAGIDTGPATDICWECAEKIWAVVNKVRMASARAARAALAHAEVA